MAGDAADLQGPLDTVEHEIQPVLYRAEMFKAARGPTKIIVPYAIADRVHITKLKPDIFSERVLGDDISADRLLLDARLPDGSRVCVVLGPIAAKGTQINIRRFPRASGNPEFLLQRNAITPMAMEFLLLATGAYTHLTSYLAQLSTPS